MCRQPFAGTGALQPDCGTVIFIAILKRIDIPPLMMDKSLRPYTLSFPRALGMTRKCLGDGETSTVAITRTFFASAMASAVAYSAMRRGNSLFLKKPPATPTTLPAEPSPDCQARFAMWLCARHRRGE
jgi:hypothetical protein